VATVIVGWETMDRDAVVRRTAEFLQIPEVYARELIAIETGQSEGDVVRVSSDRAQEPDLCPEQG
jgi:hypothetical protein